MEGITMLLTVQNINLTTKGELVSTTDMKLARLLSKKVTIGNLTGNAPAHFSVVEHNHVIVQTPSELYELEVQ